MIAPIRKMLLVAFSAVLLAFSTTALAGHHGGGQGKMDGDKPHSKGKVQKALVILSSASLQTHGMAMVLGNTLAQTGVAVDVLLCDKAGDLALRNASSELLKPKNVSPAMLLNKLKSQGATVKVCALYLPNSTYTQEDLMDGVSVATPPEIAAQMGDRHVRIFTF